MNPPHGSFITFDRFVWKRNIHFEIGAGDVCHKGTGPVKNKLIYLKRGDENLYTLVFTARIRFHT